MGTHKARRKLKFTIEEFWKIRLTGSVRGNSDVLEGWTHIDKGLHTFLEAPLTIVGGFGNTDPMESRVLFVSAPGAVGKSTLARQIASETGAMYVDLSAAEPVGANTLVGGLAKTSLYTPFQEGKASLVVDGLDEARMRVYQDSFAAFMRDLADLAARHVKPVVLLGRTGAVQEAWLWLSEHGIEAPVLEIGYYDRDQAAKFARIQAKDFRQKEEEWEPDGRAIDLILERLRGHLNEEDESFSGYSPVLIAVARWVADPDNPDTQNTQKLISDIEKGREQIGLAEIADSILVREQSKLKKLSFEDQTLHNRLYRPGEQLRRLVSVIYGTETPSLHAMPPKDRETYSNALKNWVSDHPFLDGHGRNPSSAVFGGMIASAALSEESTAQAALTTELGRGTVTNPFIWEFYINRLNQAAAPYMPPDHVGIVYASLRARLSLEETANLRIDAEDTSDPSDAPEVEITTSDQTGREFVPVRCSTDRDGNFRFGSHVENVDIAAPRGHVSMGEGSDLVLISPVVIDAERVTIGTDRLVVEASSDQRGAGNEVSAMVYLKARDLNAPRITSVPILRGNVVLQLSLNEKAFYPWTEYVISEENKTDDSRIDSALNRLKKILRLFGCHGKSQLAKYRGAIDHRRRAHGIGGDMRDQLLAERVLSERGPMYVLDPDRLSRVVGLTFQDVRGTGASAATLEFLRRALERSRR